MAQLSGSQVTQLQAALLDAFDQAELTQMVTVELDENLESIAGSGAQSTVVFNLIQWAERHERVGDLVRGAQTQRPGNRALAALAGELPGAAAASTPRQAAGKPAPALGGISIGKIEAVNVGETQLIDQRGATFAIGGRTEIDTGGGAYIGGHVNTGGGDFVGRDKVVHGDAVHGDKVGGDKITTGDISGTGVAIGRGASASVQQGISADDLATALAPVVDAIRQNADTATQAAALQEVEALEQELAKGQKANDTRVAGILDGLASLVPGAVAAVVSAFGTPLLGGLAGPVTQFVLGQLKRDTL